MTELNLGVSSKNFGYLGFKDLVKPLENLINLKRLTLRFAVNRVGGGGAQVLASLFKRVNKLEYLYLNTVESYFRD